MTNTAPNPSEKDLEKEPLPTQKTELSLDDLEKVSGGSLQDILNFESGGQGDW